MTVMNPSISSLENHSKRGWIHALLVRFPSYRMHCLLKEAGKLSDPQHDAQFLRHWAATSLFEPNFEFGNGHEREQTGVYGAKMGLDTHVLTVAERRFMRRVQASEERRQEWERVTDQARALNSDQVFDHFAAVTGHSVEDVLELNGHGINQQVGVPRLETGPARWNVREEKSSGDLRRRSRSSEPHRSATIGKLGSRVVLSAMAVYVMLIMVGSREQSVTFDVHSKGLPEYSWLDLGATPRGRAIPPDMYISRRYRAAVKTLRRANTSVWGYIPGIKQDLLNEGILELESAIQFQRNSFYMYPQALMLLANAYIRAGQPAKAVGLVDEVIERRGRRYHEATELRIKLRRMGLY